jgi:DNA-binding SARP family transcriptional activator
MKQLKVYVIGYPRVYIDDQPVTFPFKKAEAIFYMLMIEGQMDRIRLCSIFWPDNNEEVGKKNLRNAIYNIRKSLGIDIFDSDKRSLIKVNKDTNLFFDYDQILQLNESYIKDTLMQDEYELLKDFFVPDSIEYEDWVIYQREIFNEKIKIYLEKLINNSQATANDKINACKILIKIDEFDEKSYINLIKLYKDKKLYQKSVETFQQLESIFQKELSITPSREAYDLIDTLLNDRQTSDKNEEEICFSFGRELQLKLIQQEYNYFIRKQKYCTVLIEGEAGIGKTNLVEKFENSIQGQSYRLRMNCYQLEENYFYESFRTVIEQMGNIIKNEKLEIPASTLNAIAALYPSFDVSYAMSMNLGEDSNYHVIEKAFINLFSILSSGREMIMIIEDVHWIDKMSFQILNTLLLQNHIRMFVVITCRNVVREEVSRLFFHMKSRGDFKRIELKRFTFEETDQLIKHYVKIDPYRTSYIFRESEGNPLFIMEYVNNIMQNKDFDICNSKAGDIIRSRIVNLPQESLRILEIGAIFLDFIQLDALLSITGKSKIDLIEILDNLLWRKILVESMTSSGELKLQFSHNKIKQYVLEEMSNSKRILLHKRFAEYYEDKLLNTHSDSEYYPKLSYHYYESKNRSKYFEYRLKRFSGLVKINHEMFPEIDSRPGNNGTAVYLDKEDLEAELKSIQEEYETIKEYEHQIDFKNIEVVYLFTIGRLHVDTGNYKVGRSLIDKTIELALEIGNQEYLIKGWFKLIHQSINTFDLTLMEMALTHLERIISSVDQEGDYAKVLRLKGYFLILTGHYEEGEENIRAAIAIFNKTNNIERYILNIAASYLYLGESNRLKLNFDQALYYYEKALQICSEKNLYSGLAYILANKGRVLYEKNQILQAEKILLESKKNYDKVIFIWGRYIPNGYLALIYADLKNEKDTLYYLKKALHYTETASNSYEKGVMCRIKGELIHKCVEFDNYQEIVDTIRKSMSNCCTGQYRCFDNPAMTYEKTRIEKLMTDHRVIEIFN